MAFASLDAGDDDAEPLAEINMVPLIDVMLVLLIIFMVTAPLLTHAVKVDLPKAALTASEPRPEAIELSIDRDGQVFWNGQTVDADALETRLGETAATAQSAASPPELRLRADRQTPYEKVAQVMSAASRHGLTRLGFVTDPSEAPAR
ncbi:MAG: biopolymer transporter ExbD [Propionivibrio sp.]